MAARSFHPLTHLSASHPLLPVRSQSLGRPRASHRPPARSCLAIFSSALQPPPCQVRATRRNLISPGDASRTKSSNLSKAKGLEPGPGFLTPTKTCGALLRLDGRDARPPFGALVHDFEYHACALGSSGLRGAIEVTSLVEDQIAGGMVSVGPLSKEVYHLVGPAASGDGC